MELTDNKLLIWEEQFTKYCSYENKCINNINYIGEIKNNLNKFLGKQKKDDVLFYKSLIETSHFYLNNALKIRKIKFLKDMNYLWGKIDERKNMDEVNKSNFMALIKDYRKISEDILSAKSNNTTLIWVKDDKVESLHELEEEFTEIMNYHIKLIEFFTASVDLEKAFYCGK
jgi:hypothetical protein